MTAVAEAVQVAVRQVRLLDGRYIDLDLRGRTRVSGDIDNVILDFGWYNPSIVWHRSLATILIGMLSTHSLIYAHRCTYHSGRLAGDVCAQSDLIPTTFSLRHFERWPDNYGGTTWPFFQAVLGRWVKVGLPGLDPDITDFLQSPDKWEEEGNGWYFALVANDPERGALTEQELKSIQDGVNSAYERGAIELRDWALVWFLMGTGVRPVQIARMTIGDVLVNDGPDGREITLRIPLAKGENVIVKDRWKRKSPSVLTEVLLRYLAEDRQGGNLSEPLFFSQSRAVANKISAIFSKVETYSTRLKGPIPVFPYRFRYTLGTRALALGASDHEVARLLTHRTTHCIQYYRAAMPALQAPIRDALGPEMTYLAQAFQGRLINTLDEATRKGEASAVIRDFAHLLGQKLGACGTRAECHQDAPRACLYCRKFEPLRDAPWEELLHILMRDMEQETEDRIKLITLDHISAVRGIIADRDGVVVGAVA